MPLLSFLDIHVHMWLEYSCALVSSHVYFFIWRTKIGSKKFFNHYYTSLFSQCLSNSEIANITVLIDYHI